MIILAFKTPAPGRRRSSAGHRSGVGAPTAGPPRVRLGAPAPHGAPGPVPGLNPAVTPPRRVFHTPSGGNTAAPALRGRGGRAGGPPRPFTALPPPQGPPGAPGPAGLPRRGPAPAPGGARGAGPGAAQAGALRWLRRRRRGRPVPVFSLISQRTLNRAGFILWQFRACFLQESTGQAVSAGLRQHGAFPSPALGPLAPRPGVPGPRAARAGRNLPHPAWLSCGIIFVQTPPERGGKTTPLVPVLRY